MDEPFFPGATAFEHIRALVEDIGPRPSGSAAEKSALDYVMEQLIKWGYSPERKPIKYAPFPKFSPLAAGVSLFLILGGWGIIQIPYFSIWMPLILFAYPFLSRLEVQKRKRTGSSEVVVAYSSSDKQLPVLYLCAHVDTGRAFPYKNSFIRWMNTKSMYILQRIAILFMLVALLELARINIPPLLYSITGILGTAAGLIFVFLDISRQLIRTERYSPGAVDNASGVGLVLTMSEYFATYPLKRIRLGFLFTGAEETGLFGADEFARQLEKGQQSAVLNLDMVGAGDTLQYISREGTIFPCYTDPKLNQVLRDSYPAIKPYWYTVRSGDFAAFLRHKIPAASLQTSGSTRAENAYHTTEDTLDKIDPRTLKMVEDVIIRFIELLPYSDVFRV